VKVSFVGHPLLDVIRVENEEGLPSRGPDTSQVERMVGLLPGSRISEIARLLPVILDAAALLVDSIPTVHFIVPLASTISRDQINPYLEGRNLPLTVVEGDTYGVIRRCEMIIAASGTVTLEAAVLGTPLVVVYKVNPLTYWLGKRLIKVKHVALANIIAGETVAPELIQHRATPERIASEAMRILGDASRLLGMKQRLQKVREKLGDPGASDKAAAIALELMERRN
jgi:lipid-A-disaccharide synthase